MAVFDRKEDYLAIRWAQQVKQRDFFTCQVCGRQDQPLESHHLNAWASFPDQRYDIDNGVCLCITCHEMAHSVMGKGSNTKEQFEEFEAVYCALIKHANRESINEIIVKKCIKSIESEDIVNQILEDLRKEENDELL